MNISFVTIHMKDMTQSLAFYRDILGLRVVRDFSPTNTMRIVFLQGEGSGQIELIEDNTMKTSAPHSACTHVTIGIRVQNIEAVFQRMQEQQVTITRNWINARRGPKMFFIEDPNGVEVEFIQE